MEAPIYNDREACSRIERTLDVAAEAVLPQVFAGQVGDPAVAETDRRARERNDPVVGHRPDHPPAVILKRFRHGPPRATTAF
jgi:hypothetical protein